MKQYLIAFQYNDFDDNNVDSVTNTRIAIYTCNLANTPKPSQINHCKTRNMFANRRKQNSSAIPAINSAAEI